MILFLHQGCAVFQSQACDAVDYAVIQDHHMSKGPLTLKYYSVVKKITAMSVFFLLINAFIEINT